MPIPIAPLIIAGSSLLGGAANSAATRYQNRRSQQFVREQYKTERDDNLRFWRMQNDYNSASSQVQRLKDANLNPALLYGGSAAGAAGSAGSLSAPSAKNPQFNSSRPGDAISQAGLSYMNSMYDLELKQAQTNNLKSQNNVILQDAALRAAQVSQTLAGTDRTKFDLGLASELRSVSAQAAKENLRKMQTDTQVALNRDERDAAMNSSNLREAAERVLSIRAQRANTTTERNRIKAQISNIRKDGKLKDMDIELRKLGISPNTPWWGQLVGRLLSQLTGGSSLGSLLPSNPEYQKPDWYK